MQERKIERRKKTFPESLGRGKTENKDDGGIKNKTAFALNVGRKQGKLSWRREREKARPLGKNEGNGSQEQGKNL